MPRRTTILNVWLRVNRAVRVAWFETRQAEVGCGDHCRRPLRSPAPRTLEPARVPSRSEARFLPRAFVFPTQPSRIRLQIHADRILAPHREPVLERRTHEGGVPAGSKTPVVQGTLGCDSRGSEHRALRTRV